MLNGQCWTLWEIWGVLVMWNLNMVQVTEKIKSQFSITLLCKSIDTHCKWVHTIAYGPVIKEEKLSFGEELGPM